MYTKRTWRKDQHKPAENLTYSVGKTKNIYNKYESKRKLRCRIAYCVRISCRSPSPRA